MSQIPTGVPGLDRVLNGGLVGGHNVLVQGTPGAGKTTLGMQFIHEGATQFNEPGLIISFEEHPEQLHREALNFGWDLKALEVAGKLKILATSPAVFKQQMENSQELIPTMAREMGVKRILIDSLSHFQRVEQDPVKLRELLSSTLNGLKRGGYTTLVTQEVGHEESGEVAFEQYIVDAVIRIFFTAFKRVERRRAIEVLKARGQTFMAGKHAVYISDRGLRVYPRPQPELPVISLGAALQRVSSGIYGLDRMLEGGLLASSSLLVAGDPGVGKTLLTLHFLAAGPEAGEKGLFVSLGTDPAKLVQSAKSIGMNLAALEEAGQLFFLTRSPVNLDPDQFYWELRDFLDANPVQRIVIDSLTDLEPALDDPKRLRDYLYSLIDLFAQRGITSMITRQSMGEGGLEYDVAMVFDGIMMMRLKSMQDHLRKTLSILKMQGTPHDSGTRTVKISSQGYQVETKFEPTSAFLRHLQQGGGQGSTEETFTPQPTQAAAAH